MASLYIHIPFCVSKCNYCSFCSFAGKQELFDEYIMALKLELTRLGDLYGSKKLNTLFVGGGTPTALPAHQVCELFAHCFAVFEITDEAEVSIEANPGTVDYPYFRALMQAGVNRLSLGVQSFDDVQLGSLGRAHSSNDACIGLENAVKAGFTNINIDLMYGIVGQDADSWKKSLETAIALSPQHLSPYQLNIEEGTVMKELIESGKVCLPLEAEVLKMDAYTAEICAKAGFHQYEISNFCLDGFACNHNINYWQNGDYLAAGSSAVSYIDGVREKRVADPSRYISAVVNAKPAELIAERECLSLEESMRETVIMGLRMNQGVSLSRLIKRYGITVQDHYGPVLENLLKFGMVELTADYLRITAKGWPLSNRIMAELV